MTKWIIEQWRCLKNSHSYTSHDKLNQGIWIYTYFMPDMLDTKLAYNPKYIEHWMFCCCIFHTLECFLCLRCSWCVSTHLLFEDILHLLHSNYSKGLFLSMWWLRTKWQMRDEQTHVAWLLERSGTIMFLVHVHGQYLLYWEGVIA